MLFGGTSKKQGLQLVLPNALVCGLALSCHREVPPAANSETPGSHPSSKSSETQTPQAETEASETQSAASPSEESARATSPSEQETLISLSQLRESYAIFTGLLEMEIGAPEEWLQRAQGRSLWLGAQGQCTELVPSQDKTWNGKLEVCQRSDETTRTSCKRELTLQGEKLQMSTISCHQRDLQDESRMHGYFYDQQRVLSLAGSENQPLELHTFFEIKAVADRHLLVRSPCSAGSAERAFDAIVASNPQASQEEQKKALRLSHGIELAANQRTCSAITGFHLQALNDDSGAPGVGVFLQDEDLPVDCSRPCPISAPLAELRQVNQLLSKLRFFHPEQESALVFTEQEHCAAHQELINHRLGAAAACEGSDSLR